MIKLRGVILRGEELEYIPTEFMCSDIYIKPSGICALQEWVDDGQMKSMIHYSKGGWKIVYLVEQSPELILELVQETRASSRSSPDVLRAGTFTIGVTGSGATWDTPVPSLLQHQDS